MIYTKLMVEGTEIGDSKNITVNKNISSLDATSVFTSIFNNFNGEYAETFNLNDDVIIYAAKDSPIETPIAQWRMNDDLADTVVVDTIGNNDGVSSQNTEDMSVAGKISNALEFNGVNDYIDCGSDASVLPDAFTVSSWVKVKDYTKQTLLSFGAYSSALHLEWAGTGRPIIQLASDNYMYFKAGAWNAINDGEWHHVVFTVPGNSQQDINDSAMYVDGVSYAQDSRTTTGPQASKTHCYIGAEDSTPGFPFNGSMDDVRIYNKVLDIKEIQRIYNKGNGTEDYLEHSDNKIFGGVIENIDFSGYGINQTVVISGRDYGALLQDITINPIVYRDEEVSDIVKDIIAIENPGVTTTNVDTTSTTVERLTINRKNIYDALRNLADLSAHYFYVDPDKDLHFKQKDAVSSGYTLDNTNVTEGGFKKDDRDIYNQVYVYGKRLLTGASDNFITDGTGSVFTLNDKPHNTTVFLDDIIQVRGGIVGVDDTSTPDIKWLLDFDKKEVMFVSGTKSGDNIPTSGAFLSVDYNRSTPILKYVQDISSVSTYGAKTKMIVDQNLQTFEEASEYANAYLTEHKDVIIDGSLSVEGIIDITPGETVICNFPHNNINNQSYSVIQANYVFNTNNCTGDKVLKVRLNKKVNKLEDTLKELILRQKETESEILEGSLTRLETGTGEVELQSHYEVYGVSGTNFVFKFNVQGADVLNSPHAVLGPWTNGSTLLVSGGDF